MGMPQSAVRRHAVTVIGVLVIGVLAGLIVGGAIRLLGPDGGAAEAAAVPEVDSRPSAPPGSPPPTAEASALKQGRVAASDAVADLTTEVALGRERTQDGAAAAFTAYAAWLIGSPAARDDPEAALRVVGGRLVTPSDARLLIAMKRKSGDGLSASAGAYRILGRSGAASAPDSVMVEVTAPLTVDGRTRWATVGGVVAWTPTGWQLVSIRPREVPQPGPGRRDVRALSPAERAKTLAGIGWQAFTTPEGR